jgi:hypothetical protein
MQIPGEKRVRTKIKHKNPHHKLWIMRIRKTGVKVTALENTMVEIRLIRLRLFRRAFMMGPTLGAEAGWSYSRWWIKLFGLKKAGTRI